VYSMDGEDEEASEGEGEIEEDAGKEDEAFEGQDAQEKGQEDDGFQEGEAVVPGQEKELTVEGNAQGKEEAGAEGDAGGECFDDALTSYTDAI